MFHGSLVALVTPMKSSGQIDLHSLQQLVEFHIAAGTDGLVVTGTTGEAGTLSGDEKMMVIKTVVAQARERLPIIAGTAANATKECIELTQAAMQQGVDAVLIMTPAYIKPTQEGLCQHYQHIANAVPIPIILYNVPGRTACDLLPETVMKLSTISNIIGIKEATGQIDRLRQLRELCGAKLDIYSGDDATAAQWLLEGAKGVISVTANVVPEKMARLCKAAQANERENCMAINEQLILLHELLFLESNPIPTKWALSKMNLIENELRLPLTPLSVQYQDQLAKALHDLQLI